MTPVIDVTAAIIRKGEKVLIAQRGLGRHLAGKWEFPGGRLEAEESPEACLQRELLEEMGVNASVREHVCTVTHDYGEKIVRLLCFLVTLEHEDFQLTAHDQVAWATLEELGAMDMAAADIPVVEYLKKVKES